MLSNIIITSFSHLFIQKQILCQAKALRFSKTCQLLVERLTEGQIPHLFIYFILRCEIYVTVQK